MIGGDWRWGMGGRKMGEGGQKVNNKKPATANKPINCISYNLALVNVFQNVSSSTYM